jgi:hypothetical protein
VLNHFDQEKTKTLHLHTNVASFFPTFLLKND